MERIDGNIFSEPIEKLKKSFAEEDGIVYLKYSEPGIKDPYRLTKGEMAGIGLAILVFAVVWHFLFNTLKSSKGKF